MALVFHSVYDVPSKTDSHGIWRNLLDDVSFRGDVGWGIGSSQLIRSTDGGRNWENLFHRAYPYSGVQQKHLSVPADDACIVVYSHGNTSSGCIRTSDRGESWETVYSSRSITLTGVYFLDSSTGFLTGHTKAASQRQIPILLKTEDSGKNWNPCALPVLGRKIPAYASNPARIVFKDADVGVLLYRTANESLLYLTEDGGCSWRNIGIFPTELWNIFFTRSGQIVAYGAAGTLAVRMPDSKTWKTVLGLPKQTIYQLCEAEWGYYLVSSDFDDETDGLCSTIFFSRNLDHDWLILCRSPELGGLFYLRPTSPNEGVAVSSTNIYSYSI